MSVGVKEEKSGIPQCLASNYIINSMLARDLSFAIELLGVNAEVHSPSPLLYVNCLDLENLKGFYSEDVANELPMSPIDLLTDSTGVCPVLGLLN